MRQALSSAPFISQIIGAPGPAAGRWSGVKDLPPLVVRTIAALAEGRADLDYCSGFDPLLVLGAGPGPLGFRTRSRQVYSAGTKSQEPETLTLFAAYLLLADKSSFPIAYLKLLEGLAEPAVTQPQLDRLMRAAGKALVSGCKRILGSDTRNELVWFYAISGRDGTFFSDLTNPGGLKMASLLSGPTKYAAFLASKAHSLAWQNL
jgi:hypothetical protein